jgi:hypothetical protein
MSHYVPITLPDFHPREHTSSLQARGSGPSGEERTYMFLLRRNVRPPAASTQHEAIPQ